MNGGGFHAARLMFSQTALSGEELMKQANLGVSSSPLRLSGGLLLAFLADNM